MLSSKIRRAFIQYFVQHKHRHVPSSSVVPHDDPTLLFCNAGMNQFKSYFLGQEKPSNARAVTAQKCIRVGGKHNDLENVGHTTRHLTFFEMMGNFSFGDYFKKEAIQFAWEVCQNVFELDLDRVWASVYEEDDESYELWKQYLPEARIARLGAKDNFWQMGDVGPCGPCSELLFDRGSKFGEITHPREDVAGERFFEFWNLVFMQFNKEKDQSMQPLFKPSVDTGWGLERLVSLKMGVDSVFETDIFSVLIQEIEDHFKMRYQEQQGESKAAFCVIADHLRALAFAIADGAQPSNTDRGYVLRKILRRAVRYGRVLGAQKPFLSNLLPKLTQLMQEDYPELKIAEVKTAEILNIEEESFLKTLKRGGNLLHQIIKKSKEHDTKIISGDDAFLLKDTYGFPLEEIQLMAKDAHLGLDIDRFEKREQQAKEISKKGHQDQSKKVADDFYSNFASEGAKSTFCGYTCTECEGNIIGIVKDHQWVQTLHPGEEGLLILDQTPFYAEKGGQVGDQGVLTSSNATFKVQDTQSPFNELIAHKGVMQEGSLSVQEKVLSKIDITRRQKIAANHTATHLLHYELQQVLGEHIKQGGSLVQADRLRFDFSHHKAVSKEQLIEVENKVNAKIRTNQQVKNYEMSYQEAQEQSEIKQFFGDKYGERVRVVDIDFSKELCGGNHAKALGQIGLFRITKESSIAAGIRRIEAVTGQAALEFSRESEELLETLAGSLKTTPHKLCDKIALMQAEQKKGQEELKKLTHERNMGLIEGVLKEKKEIQGVSLAQAKVSLPKKELRDFILQMSEKLQSGVCVVCSCEGEVVQLAVAVSQDLVKTGLLAKNVVNASMAPIEGKGGGKAEFAQAGGTHPEKIPLVFEKVEQYLQEL